MTHKWSRDGILRTYTVNNTNMTVDFFTLRDVSDDPKFDMEQPYQRGVVWGLKRKRNLIKSMLMGVPIPAILLNDRFAAKFSHEGYHRNRNWCYAIVDGKQRITAILGFMNNEFSCPGEWWGMKEHEVFWRDLEVPHQRFFRGTPLPVANGQFKTLAQEEELFNLINFGGLAQGEVDEDVQS